MRDTHQIKGSFKIIRIPFLDAELYDFRDLAGEMVMQRVDSLRQVTDSVPLIKGRDGLIKDCYMSLVRFKDAQYVFDQGAFAGSVGTGDAQIVSSLDGKGNIVDYFCPVVTEREMIDLDYFSGHCNPF